MIALALVAVLAGQGPIDDGTTGVAWLFPPIGQARWAQAPTRQDLARVKPTSPMRGVVGFDCAVRPNGSLKDCKAFSEQPADLGFRRAAQTLIPKFRLSKSDSKAALRQQKSVRVWIAFGGSEGCFFPYCTIDPPPPPSPSPAGRPF
jgi:protein TonB